MFKKSIKYFLIAGINAGLLTILLALWTDDLEITFNSWVRPIEFLKIIGLTFISLLAMRILVGVMNKRVKVNLAHRKLIYSSLLTLAISSYFYVSYVAKAYSTLFDEIRPQLLDKIEVIDVIGVGTTADSLTNHEYSLLTNITWFPEIHETAYEISYTDWHEGFLPDYTFLLTYTLPDSIDIDEMHLEEGRFSKELTVKVEGDRKLVTYMEGQH
jgi:hypothetical protein